VVVAVLLAGCSFYALKGQPPATRPSSATPPEHAFTGKILVVNLKSDPDTTLIIENPTISPKGGRDFLVGIGIDDGDEEEWRGGLTVWTAMDDISQIVEVRDLEDLKRRMEDSEDDEKKPARA